MMLKDGKLTLNHLNQINFFKLVHSDLIETSYILGIFDYIFLKCEENLIK